MQGLSDLPVPTNLVKVTREHENVWLRVEDVISVAIDNQFSTDTSQASSSIILDEWEDIQEDNPQDYFVKLDELPLIQNETKVLKQEMPECFVVIERLPFCCNGDVFICTRRGCLKLYSDLTTLAQHLMEHDRLRRFRCSFCDKVFDSPGQLKVHFEDSHLGSNVYKCDKCKAAFSEERSLRNHYLIHSGVISLKEVNDHKPIQTKQTLYSCAKCNKSFKRRYELNRHQLSLACMAKITESNEECYRCEVCEDTFKTVTLLRNHLSSEHDIDDRLYECDQCGKKFGRCSDMNKHNLIMHYGFKSDPDIKPFRCEHCGKTFKRNWDKKRHILTMHLSDKPFKCDLCGRGFPRRNHLTNHMIIHNHNRSFKCETPDVVE